MFPALLAAFFFAASAVVSQRATRIFGAVTANFYRLAIACAVLGLATWVHDAGRGASSLHPELFMRFFWSGLVGFGIGDVALFLAYARLGSRLTILINWCSAALFAAAGDYWMRGRGLTPVQWGAVLCILSGLFVALWPSGAGKQVRHPICGLLFAVIAGISMGFGTALSGGAIDAANQQGIHVPGVSQAFQRASAGLIAAGLAFCYVSWSRRNAAPQPAKVWKHKPFWLLSTALFGPVLGVSCYQWAQAATGSSTIVVAIASTSTLLVIPLARIMEKDHPGWRQMAGTLLAAAGVAALKFFG